MISHSHAPPYQSQSISHLVFIPLPQFTINSSEFLLCFNIVIAIIGVLVFRQHSEQNICQSQGQMSLHCRENRRFYNATYKHRQACSVTPVGIEIHVVLQSPFAFDGRGYKSTRRKTLSSSVVGAPSERHSRLGISTFILRRFSTLETLLIYLPALIT